MAATAPLVPPPPPHITNNTHAQIQIRNREEIKRQQVLINFDKGSDFDLDYLDEYTLSRKALDAINSTWTTAQDPKPTSPKLKAATLMRNGGLLLELDSAQAADWLRKPAPRDSFLSNLGLGANIKDRFYQVIVQFAPIQFDPNDNDQLHQYEIFNGLETDSIVKAEWIKPAKDRKPHQKVATLRIYHKDATSANIILKHGAYILNKRTVPKKPKKEPIRCLRCQCFGHKCCDCKNATPKCGRCADPHETATCPTDNYLPKCSNCTGQHPSYDRECPSFREKCHQIDSRCPENKLVFYPTDENWTWTTYEHVSPPPEPNSPPRYNNNPHQQQGQPANHRTLNGPSGRFPQREPTPLPYPQ